MQTRSSLAKRTTPSARCAFGRPVLQTGGVDPGTGALLRRLFELRSVAAYEGGQVDTVPALSALTEAERFIQTVAGWLDRAA